MAFLDETGLAELWGLISAEDAKSAKIAHGSYGGSGKYGASNKNTLTFDFAPKLVVVHDPNGRNFLLVRGASKVLAWISGGLISVDSTSASGYDPQWATLTISWGETSVSWYAASSAQYQYNYSGYTYYYIAIG